MSEQAELPVVAFKSLKELHAWLVKHHTSSSGIWIRVYKKSSQVASVSFEDVLDEGLAFGWSESTRHKYDEQSYLQKFTPRKTIGTTSKRNLERARMLMQAGRMTPPGLKALGL